MRNTIIDILEAALRKIGLPFFIVAFAICLAGVYSWASESFTVSCTVPAIAGLNAPVVEDEKPKAEEARLKDEAPKPQRQDTILFATQATIKTLYSR